MTVKELIEKLTLIPDDYIVCVQNDTSPIEANEIVMSKFWKKNVNPSIRVYAYEKDCVVIK